MRLRKSKAFKEFMLSTLSLCLAILFYFVLTKYSTVKLVYEGFLKIFRPFVIGIALAYILNPVAKIVEGLLSKKIKKKSVSRLLSILLVLLVLGLLLYLLVILIIPQVIESVNILIKQVPEKSQELMNVIRKQVGDNKVLLNYVNQFYNQAGASINKFVQTTLLPSLTNVVSGVSAGVISVATVLKNVLIGIIVAVYLLLNKELFLKQCKLIVYSIFPRHKAVIFLDEVHYADKMFSGFISGKLIDSLIIGVLCGIFCIAVKMPSGLLVSVLVGITNVIPFFGPYIGAIPCVFLIFIQSPTMAVVFVIFIILLQQLDGNVIGPMILGDSIGLSGFWVLFAILVFGGMFGFVGMIVGVPVFAVIYDIIRKLVHYILVKREREDLIIEYQEYKENKA